MSNEVQEALNEIENASDVKTCSLPAIRGWCSTGCTILDLAITGSIPGGLPVGRIIHIYGGEATAKTLLGVVALGYYQRNGESIYYDDVEHTLNPVYAKRYGLDMEKDTFNLFHSNSVEDLFDVNLASVLQRKKKKPAIYVVDSLTALPTEVEKSAGMKDGTYGTSRAKQIGLGLRKYNYALASTGTTLFCIDQTRDDIGGGLVHREVVPGGRALPFYSSVQIYLKNTVKILNKRDKIVGRWVKFRIDKNKVGPPMREGIMRILFEYGLDDISTNLFFLSEFQNGIEKAKNKTTTIEFNGDKKKMSTWIKYIEDGNLEMKLREEVAKVWVEVYKTEDRKPRVW